jgi:hypothetical protein
LIGSGLVHADAFDGLTVKQLVAVAKASVRASRRADAVAALLPTEQKIQKTSDTPCPVVSGGPGAIRR